MKIILEGEESPWLPSSVSATKVPEPAEGPRTPTVGLRRRPATPCFIFLGTDMFTGTFRRNGEGDYLCTRDEVGSIYRDAGHISQDCKIIKEVSLDSLCKETITHYRQRFRLSHDGHVWNSYPDVEFLKKIGAAKISQDDGKVYPTAAGLLMFGYESEIVYEYPLYFLDYQEHYDETTRWSDRFVSSSGEWSGNVFDFFLRS